MHEITSKLLVEPCRPQCSAYCHTMDLIATVTDRQAVDVWRFNGQRVFGLAAEEQDEDGDGSRDGNDRRRIAALAWKSDGQMLAVVRSDGIVQLIDSFSGKIAHRFTSVRPVVVGGASFSSSSSLSSSVPLSQPQPGIVSSSLWSTNFANAEETSQQLDKAGPNVTIDDLSGLNADVSKLLKAKAVLPRELARVDIETSLPKLSSLPATGTDDDVFSTRSSIDSIFHSQNAAGGLGKRKDNVVRILVIGFDNCTLHIRIFNSFEVGTLDVSRALPKGLRGRQILQHASHPFSSTHFVLVEGQSDLVPGQAERKTGTNDASLHLLGLDLRFIPQTSHNLPLLATKATQLQNLLRYMLQIQSQLTQEVRSAFDLPGRFLRNLNESLAEHDESSSFLTAAYHLVITGECDPRLKEWLVDELGERGLKRWEKAVGDCLETIRRMTSECLLPALERCQVVLSRLDGLARFQTTATRLGLDHQSIKAVRETIDVLTILGEDLLKDVCVEIREFGAFMRWMKWEAEVEALEEGSERAEELRETYVGESELRTVLDYTNGALRESRVLEYIDTTGTEPRSSAGFAEGKGEEGDSQFYENYKRARNSVAKEKRLPKLGHLLQRLTDQSDKVFARIAETLRKSVLTSHLIALPSDMARDSIDMRVIASKKNQGGKIYQVHMVARHMQDSRTLCHVQLQMENESGKGLRRMSEKSHKIQISLAENILDIKFVDDDGFIVLVSMKDCIQIRWYPIEGAADNDEEEDVNGEVRHVFDDGRMSSGMKPSVMKVNGRKGRRAVAVFDEAGLGFAVFDLDSEGPSIAGDERDEIMTG